MWYNLDIKKLSVLLLPTFLRKSSMIAWMNALVSPLSDVLFWFQKNRENNLYTMAHNGQVCYLKKVLNDRFDSYGRRIEITDGNRYQRQYIYTRGEEKPKRLGRLFLYDRANYGDTGVDFIVLVPLDLIFNSYEMKALIDLYRLGSKRYIIQKK